MLLSPSYYYSMMVASSITFFLTVLCCRLLGQQKKGKVRPEQSECEMNDNHEDSFSVLPCIRNRRSIFPNQYMAHPGADVDPKVIKSLLDAALWGPYHGRCFAGCDHPARFVVLGKRSMVEMQHLTLRYYDRNWKTLDPWGCGADNDGDESEERYRDWRKSTEDEITGRWGPVSCMVAIVMRRQTSPVSKRLPEWEEAAAVACAVHNMHLQQCARFPHLACYWSSWHDAARDSDDMKTFLDMGAEDKCMGFFVVAQAKPSFLRQTRDRRKRDPSIMQTEWRP